MKEKEKDQEQGKRNDMVGEDYIENKDDVTQEIPDEPWSEEVEPASHREYMLF